MLLLLSVDKHHWSRSRWPAHQSCGGDTSCHSIRCLVCCALPGCCSEEAFKMLSNELLGFIRRQVGSSSLLL